MFVARAISLVAAVGCALAFLCTASSAHAARNIATGVTDPHYLSTVPTERATRFDLSVDVHAGVARIDVLWVRIAGSEPPASPRDPNDPAYDFTALDDAIRDARARGLDVLLTVYWAPHWAEGPNRPPVDIFAPAGTWRPDPVAFADFGAALATRYSGNFVPASGGAPLPEARYFEAWNEENLWAYLSPQYEGGFVAADHYRLMLNAFYDAVHAANGEARVLIGGNAPYGDPPGGQRSRPLVFLRDLFCLTARLRSTPCPAPAKFDILGLHPINLSGGPTTSALSPDDVTTPDVPHAVKVLRAAEEAGTAAGRRHPVWVTEFWWSAFPGDPDPDGLSLAKAAKYTAQSLYLFWQAKVKVAINYEVCDLPAPDPQDTLYTGLFLADCSPKPSATAFRFPLVVERTSKSEAEVWGRAPETGALKVQKRSRAGWRKVATVKANRDRVFTTTFRARTKGKYRAVVGDEVSLVWSLRR